MGRKIWRAYATKGTYFQRTWFILATGKRWITTLRARWYTLSHRASLAHVIRQASWEDFERLMIEAGYVIKR